MLEVLVDLCYYVLKKSVHIFSCVSTTKPHSCRSCTHDTLETNKEVETVTYDFRKKDEASHERVFLTSISLSSQFATFSMTTGSPPRS